MVRNSRLRAFFRRTRPEYRYPRPGLCEVVRDRGGCAVAPHTHIMSQTRALQARIQAMSPGAKAVPRVALANGVWGPHAGPTRKGPIRLLDDHTLRRGSIRPAPHSGRAARLTVPEVSMTASLVVVPERIVP